MTPKELPRPDSNSVSDKTMRLPQIVSSLSEEKTTTSSFKKSNRHLVIHFDVNETILVGDEAGGDTREDCLNKILAKSAFVQCHENTDVANLKKFVPTHWWDGTPIGQEQQLPPLYTGWHWPPGCCPYYRTSFKKRAKQFTHFDGAIYKPLYEEMERRLTLAEHELKGPPKNNVLSHMIPAIFHTLDELTRQEQSFTIVFRTFGSDLPDVAQAISAFAQGKHPQYPNFHNPNLILEKDSLYCGRWKRTNSNDASDSSSTDDMLYQLWTTSTDENDHERTLVASGDAEIVELMESKTICGIRDDYSFWSQNECEPWAGKPVWVPRDSSRHHLLLDDNIHNLAHDSIASVRIQHDEAPGYKTLSGKEILSMQGSHLVRVPTIEPIMNPDWFLEQIAKSQQVVSGHATL